MILGWLLSPTVRQASNLHRHAQRIVNAQRDLLSTPAVEKIAAAIAAVRAAIASNADGKLLKERMADLERTTAKWIQPYPRH